jgi:hypothetical protein
MHLPISMSFNSVISLIFPSAQATIPSPIFLSGSLKNINKNIAFRNTIFVNNKKMMPINLSIKMTNNINALERAVPDYELEIDLSSTKSKLDKNNLELIYKECNIILKLVQQSNYIISRSLEDEVLGNYASLLGVTKENMIGLAGRKSQSLEVQHVVDQLPNKYAITDKADGERYFLIIHRNSVFLISDLLRVRNTGIILNKNQSNFNNTILDGELIFLKNYNKYLFVGFDCLYDSNQDIRQVASFLERLTHLENVVNNCFVDKDHKKEKSYDYKSDKFDIDAIIKFHGDNIKKYFDD